MAETDTTMDLGEVFQLLADDSRRGVLYRLRSEEEATVEELASYLVEHSGGAATGDDLRDTITTLHHDHLPALHDADLLQYDRDKMRARSGPYAEDLRPLLEVTEEMDDFSAPEP